MAFFTVALSVDATDAYDNCAANVVACAVDYLLVLQHPVLLMLRLVLLILFCSGVGLES